MSEEDIFAEQALAFDKFSVNQYSSVMGSQGFSFSLAERTSSRVSV